MLIAFQVILLIVMILSVMGVIAEKEKEFRKQIIGMFFASVIAMVITIYL